MSNMRSASTRPKCVRRLKTQSTRGHEGKETFGIWCEASSVPKKSLCLQKTLHYSIFNMMTEQNFHSSLLLLQFMRVEMRACASVSRAGVKLRSGRSRSVGAQKTEEC